VPPVPVPDFEPLNFEPATKLAASFDRLILGKSHIREFIIDYDPEGILSTLPTAVSGFIGVYTLGRDIEKKKTALKKQSFLCMNR
jgi:predicted acyltransferase